MKWHKNESGMLVVEATIVFPVMFLVIFLMIFAGNAFYQKCRIEAIVCQTAIDSAAYCGDSMLDDVEAKIAASSSGSAIPEFDTVEIEPYRYLFGGMSNIVSSAEATVKEKITKLGTGLFTNMSPENVVVDANFNNGFIYSTFSIDTSYKVVIPIRLLGESDYISFKASTRTDVPVSDSPEMIRNINMIEDYMEKTGAMGAIEKMVNKVKTWFGGGK